MLVRNHRLPPTQQSILVANFSLDRLWSSHVDRSPIPTLTPNIHLTGTSYSDQETHFYHASGCSTTRRRVPGPVAGSRHVPGHRCRRARRSRASSAGTPGWPCTPHTRKPSSAPTSRSAVRPTSSTPSPAPPRATATCPACGNSPPTPGNTRHRGATLDVARAAVSSSALAANWARRSQALNACLRNTGAPRPVTATRASRNGSSRGNGLVWLHGPSPAMPRQGRRRSVLESAAEREP
ncbi:MAG: hypothetical protein JWQ81_244 [Amycolatopsis sp.]|nr:hypothetical protein [Amycolatopsis sp.]